jgi:hypothetical protein
MHMILHLLRNVRPSDTVHVRGDIAMNYIMIIMHGW